MLTHGMREGSWESGLFSIAVGRWRKTNLTLTLTSTLLFFLSLRRSYRSPRNYSTPRNYRSPRAEDARVTYGGGDSGPGGRDGGGGGGGGGGRGGGGGGRGRGGRGFGGEPWSLITIAAAALVAAGGGMAYKKKGSRASLEAGAALGGVLLAAASLQTGAATQGAGLVLALVCSSALAAYMSKNFARTKKAWPHGALAAFGLVLSGGYVSALSGLGA